jgi:hypothetical protein
MAGSAPTNSQAVDFEKQQAAEADAKEAARQARLTQGQTLIDQIFNGQPVMGTKTTPFDWSNFQSGALPAGVQTTSWAQGGTPTAPSGYTAVRVAPRTAATPGAAPSRYTTAGQPGDAATVNASSTSGASPVWALKDASGKVYYPGDPLSITSQYDTGQKTGGFNDDFYNAYKQKVLDYYNPDEQRQYEAAQRDLTYNLARAGTLQSSTAADKQGELAYNDALQKANIVANANTQEGNLKNQIQANKESLINQLYATEDPTLTANLAESSAAASRLQDPTLTPAAALFTPALSAVGSVVNSLSSPYNNPYGAGYTGQTSPTPAAANSSSGVLKSSGGPVYG